MTGARGVSLAVRDASRPLVVLGPSLGTSVEALWHDVLPLVSDHVDIVGFDLPGHGTSPGVDGAVTVAGLARDVQAIAAAAQRARDDEGSPWWYAGVSVGGAVGLQLLLDEPHALAGAMLVSTGARIGDPDSWERRASLVERAGTPTQVEGSAARWFAPGFVEAHPEVTTRLLAGLQMTDRHGYAAVCRALGAFDVRDRLAEIVAPVLAVAAEHDAPTPVASLADIAARVQHGRLVVLDDAAHLPPAEQPERIAEQLLTFMRVAPDGERERHAAGMRVRREVLSDEHVDRATATASATTAEFQDLITRYAWGEIWTRPGLDRRMRSAIALTALVAGQHWDELAMHLRAALRNGLTRAEIREVLLQSAIYCSVPSANHAFQIADRVMRDERDRAVDAHAPMEGDHDA